MTLEEQIEQVNAAGWWVNNLFQLDDAGWQANLRQLLPTHTGMAEFGQGSSPAEALAEAFRCVTEGRVEKVKPREKKVLDIASLLDDLPV